MRHGGKGYNCTAAPRCKSRDRHSICQPLRVLFIKHPFYRQKRIIYLVLSGKSTESRTAIQNLSPIGVNLNQEMTYHHKCPGDTKSRTCLWITVDIPASVKCNSLNISYFLITGCVVLRTLKCVTTYLIGIYVS